MFVVTMIGQAIKVDNHALRLTSPDSTASYTNPTQDIAHPLTDDICMPYRLCGILNLDLIL